jgi:uncharacterized protein (DUF1778 family)
MAPKDTRIGIRASTDVKSKVEALAAHDGLTVSAWLIRQIVREHRKLAARI